MIALKNRGLAYQCRSGSIGWSDQRCAIEDGSPKLDWEGAAEKWRYEGTSETRLRLRLEVWSGEGLNFQSNLSNNLLSQTHHG